LRAATEHPCDGATERGTPEFVLDSSVSLVWAFEDEVSAYAEQILDRLPDTAALVPGIWSLEVANALLVAERRGRASLTDVAQFIATLETLTIVVDDETHARALGDALHLARAQSLAAYDAAYLELAMRTGLPLATLDQRLRDAAAAVGVTLYAPG
jgi:predicted nucleic acid-binding protein